MNKSGYTYKTSRIVVPTHAHPMARLVFQLMRDTCKTYDSLEYEANVLRTTIKAWRNNNTPGLTTIEAVLGVFGWSVLPVPSAKALPADLRAELQAIADKHQRQFPALEFVALIAERAAENRLARLQSQSQNQQERLAA